MGKITEALRKAAEDRIERIDKIVRIREQKALVIKKIGDSRVDPRLVTYFDPKALITEQYKILRTNILSTNAKRPLKTLVITSSLHSEGKTVTALNLAMVIAQSTQKPKVLVVDADMRRGRVAKYLGVDQQAGLTEILTDKADPSEALFHIDMENLAFIAAGSVAENPAELLGSDKMRQFLADMKTQFDFILIDTPPIIAVTDPGIVGALVDGILMTIQAGRTQRGVIRRATELLEQSQSKIIGHVLTNIEYHLPEYIYRYL
ncbi:MAG: CpsD/CapB family tyrosine-protein kinase [Candidatus Omnitrophica bacterium]|nr:CpsD/CapB family tyrosine-protein kinase [Candidatus Omnitrophota bacterium]MBI5023787.1 CpsD/CapB family tyrosine-protein kinase [Candidatus Omnitrophota bacterium]